MLKIKAVSAFNKFRFVAVLFKYDTKANIGSANWPYSTCQAPWR